MSFSITIPPDHAKFPLGEAIEFGGTADAFVTRVELITDGEFVFPTVTVDDGKWFVANRFNVGGTRNVLAKAFDSSDNEVGSAEVSISIQVPDFGSLVRIPSGINEGVTKARQQTMIEVFGRPGLLSPECTAPTNPKVTRILVTSGQAVTSGQVLLSIKVEQGTP